jgi:hypothetical protein
MWRHYFALQHRICFGCGDLGYHDSFTNTIPFSHCNFSPALPPSPIIAPLIQARRHNHHAQFPRLSLARSRPPPLSSTYIHTYIIRMYVLCMYVQHVCTFIHMCIYTIPKYVLTRMCLYFHTRTRRVYNTSIDSWIRTYRIGHHKKTGILEFSESTRTKIGLN